MQLPFLMTFSSPLLPVCLCGGSRQTGSGVETETLTSGSVEICHTRFLLEKLRDMNYTFTLRIRISSLNRSSKVLMPLKCLLQHFTDRLLPCLPFTIRVYTNMLIHLNYFNHLFLKSLQLFFFFFFFFLQSPNSSVTPKF